MSKKRNETAKTMDVTLCKPKEDFNKENDYVDDDDVDPIKAYFKQRYTQSSVGDVFNERESYTDSSLGILDLDNVSLLDEVDNCNGSGSTINSTMFRSQTTTLSSKIKHLNKKKNQECDSEKSNSSKPFNSITNSQKSEMQLKRQRELAKNNLMQLNNRLETCLKNLKSFYGDRQESIIISGTEKGSNKEVLNSNVPISFERNQSTHNSRDCVDDTKSCNSSVSTPIPKVKDSKTSGEGFCDFSQLKTIGRISPGEITKVSNASELVFESQNADEILNRLEEDQKLFQKDQSGISNNSEISRFSGLTEGKVSQGESLENDRVSIGKYFELRSHSINSLIGAKGSIGSKENTDADIARKKFSFTDTATPMGKTPDDGINNEAKISEVSYSMMNHSKPWNSSCESKGNENSLDFSVIKHSMESSKSMSTLLIQDLLRGMDSGLSGTQINDRLLECLGKSTTEKKTLNESHHIETPKSSKMCAGGGTLRKSTKGKGDVRNSCSNQFKSPSSENNSFSKSATQFSEKASEKNENKFSKNVLRLKNEKVNRAKPLESSTPKLEHRRPGAEKSTCSKLVMADLDWAMPRLSSIQKRNSINNSLSGEDCEKTVVLNATMMPSGKEIKDAQDSRSIEDSIAAGDLTIVSDRLKDIKKDNPIVISSTDEKNVMFIVQQLANFPKGSVDCSALIPLLQNHFPELLTTISLRRDQAKSHSNAYEQDLCETATISPGVWIRIASEWKSKEICVAVDVKKEISLQIKNQTEDWLIISLENVWIQCASDIPSREKTLNAVKLNDAFHVGDFLTVSTRDTLIAPIGVSSCKICMTPKVPVFMQVKLRFALNSLNTNENRIQDIQLKLRCLFPRNNIAVTPSDNVLFGTIPDECYEQKLINLTFDGSCDLPLKIFIDKSDNFILASKGTLNGEPAEKSMWRENAFFCALKEGMKTVIQLKLIFRPRVAFNTCKNGQIDLKSVLIVAIDTSTDHRILRQIQLHGSVAFTKFLCVYSTPMLFRVTGKGNAVKKSLPLKNIGAIDLKFSLSTVNVNSGEPSDSLFIVPNSFILPKGEERSLDIVFNGETNESYVRRNLLLQLEPNGMCYEIELTGAVMSVTGGRPVSRASSHSAPSHSMYNPGNLSFHIKSTTQTISWPAVPLDVEMKQTFFIMNSSDCNAMARFSFRKDTSSFRFLNDNGESIEKLRKLLKPNCSNAMTVIFRPNSVGPHLNSIIIETNEVSGRKMISLNGYGGSPKIFVRNLKSDLNGAKIVRLSNSETESEIFHATLEFINKGNISGFVSIETIFTVLSLNNLLEIKPSNFVVPANSKMSVQISQKLKSEDFKQLLSGKDICKLATLTVTTGDEASRLRLRKLAREGKLNTSNMISYLQKKFVNEKIEDFHKFSDDERFEIVFRKNFETLEIAAIVERPNDECESTILEVAEETVKEFVTILPAADCTVASLRESDKNETFEVKKHNLETSDLSYSKGKLLNVRNKDVEKWLKTLDKP